MVKGNKKGIKQMMIFKTFKALTTLNKAMSFVEENKSYVAKIANMITKIKEVVAFFETKIAAAKETIEELQRIIKR